MDPTQTDIMSIVITRQLLYIRSYLSFSLSRPTYSLVSPRHLLMASVTIFTPSDVYDTTYDSYQTFGLLTVPCLPFHPILLDGRRLLCTNTYSADDASLCTCSMSLWSCFSVSLYISALRRTLGTPSEFSSVPILVADELVLLFPCEPRS